MQYTSRSLVRETAKRLFARSQHIICWREGFQVQRIWGRTVLSATIWGLTHYLWKERFSSATNLLKERFPKCNEFVKGQSSKCNELESNTLLVEGKVSKCNEFVEGKVSKVQWICGRIVFQVQRIGAVIGVTYSRELNSPPGLQGQAMHYVTHHSLKNFRSNLKFNFVEFTNISVSLYWFFIVVYAPIIDWLPHSQSVVVDTTLLCLIQFPKSSRNLRLYRKFRVHWRPLSIW